MLRRARTVSWRLAAHAKRRIGEGAHLLFLAVLATGVGSWKKLPSSVPYAADLSEKGAVDGFYRIKELVGTELRLDGRALGSLQLASLSSQITVSWTGARADLGSAMNGKYTVAVTGACGDVDHPVDGPYANFRNRSESDLAKLVELDHQLRVIGWTTWPMVPRKSADRRRATLQNRCWSSKRSRRSF